MKDGPGRKEPRKVEWVVQGVEPPEAVRIIRETDFGWHFVCAMRTLDEPPEPLKAGYKELGYRLLATEAFFVHSLSKLLETQAAFDVRRVLDSSLEARLAEIAGRQMLSEHLNESAPLRQYVALDNETPVGWVKSITIGNSTWCSNLYVQESHRRQGIASALMAKMLRDDKAHGAQANILLASHTGAKLYPSLGYVKIGELLIFSPKRRGS